MCESDWVTCTHNHIMIIHWRGLYTTHNSAGLLALAALAGGGVKFPRNWTSEFRGINIHKKRLQKMNFCGNVLFYDCNFAGNIIFVKISWKFRSNTWFTLSAGGVCVRNILSLHTCIYVFLGFLSLREQG